jgi:hypothetical protein
MKIALACYKAFSTIRGLGLFQFEKGTFGLLFWLSVSQGSLQQNYWSSFTEIYWNFYINFRVECTGDCSVFPSWLVSGHRIFSGKILEAGVLDARCPLAAVSDTPVFWRLANCGLYLLGDYLFPIMLLPCRRLYYFHISNNVNGTSIHTAMYFDLMLIDCCWTSGIR